MRLCVCEMHVFVYKTADTQTTRGANVDKKNKEDGSASMAILLDDDWLA